MKQIKLTTDGACKGNPGKGGWACLLQYQNTLTEIYGCELMTTNNRMELTASLMGLKLLNTPCEVEITTDSKYVMDGITKWITNWKLKGWRKIKNQDLWMELDQENSKHKTTWIWTKGHANNELNNKVDQLASLAADYQLSYLDKNK